MGRLAFFWTGLLISIGGLVFITPLQASANAVGQPFFALFPFFIGVIAMIIAIGFYKDEGSS